MSYQVCKTCGHPEHTAYCNRVCRCVGRVFGDGFPDSHAPIPSDPYPDTIELQCIQALEQQNAALERRVKELTVHLENAVNVGKGLRDAELGNLVSLQCCRDQHDECFAPQMCKCGCHKEKRSQDVQKLVEAAREAIEKNGIHGPSMQALVEALKPFEQEK